MMLGQGGGLLEECSGQCVACCELVGSLIGDVSLLSNVCLHAV